MASTAPSKLASTKITPDLVLYEPSPSPASAASPARPSDPSLVVLLAWMGAKPAHAEKYVAGFRKLFPSSPVAVILTSPKSFYLSAAHHQRSLQPALDLIRARTSQAHANGGAPSGGLLVSSMSNGGGLALMRLQQAAAAGTSASAELGEKAPLLGAAASRGLPLRALVLDSAPGGTSLKVTIRAFLAPVKAWYVWYPAVVAVTILYSIRKLWSVLSRRPPIIARMAGFLNSPAFPPAPRLYLYSMTDLIIPGEEVAAHAKKARAHGVEVAEEVFEGSPHVSHARTDPERYWVAVRRLWDRAAAQ